MRITIVTGPFLPVPPAPCGAVEQIWCGLAREFAGRSHQVSFLCRSFPTQAASEDRQGVRFVRRTRFRRTGRLWLDLVKDGLYSLRMLLLLPKADILVTNVFWLPSIAALLRPSRGCVVVNVARMPKGQMRLYRRAHRLAVVSQAVREVLAAQNPELLDKVRIISNPINTVLFKPPERRRDFSGERLILYMGRVHPEKGVHLLVQAFGALRPVERRLRLRIIGPSAVDQGGGGKTYLAELQRAAEGLPVDFFGPIADPGLLAEALRQGHYFCYPSLAEMGETFGVAPLEAMATGLVPVVSSLACFRDFIDDGENGLYFDHRAPDAAARLANALEQLVSDEVRTRCLADNAAERALQFSYTKIAEQYLSDFESLIAPAVPLATPSGAEPLRDQSGNARVPSSLTSDGS